MVYYKNEIFYRQVCCYEKRNFKYKYTYFPLIMIFLQKQISSHQFQRKEKKNQYHVHQQVKFNRPSSTKVCINRKERGIEICQKYLKIVKCIQV